MKLDDVRCNSIYRIRSRQSSLHLATSQHTIAPLSRHPSLYELTCLQPLASTLLSDRTDPKKDLRGALEVALQRRAAPRRR